MGLRRNSLTICTVACASLAWAASVLLVSPAQAADPAAVDAAQRSVCGAFGGEFCSAGYRQELREASRNVCNMFKGLSDDPDWSTHPTLKAIRAQGMSRSCGSETSQAGGQGYGKREAEERPLTAQELAVLQHLQDQTLKSPYDALLGASLTPSESCDGPVRFGPCTHGSDARYGSDTYTDLQPQEQSDPYAALDQSTKPVSDSYSEIDKGQVDTTWLTGQLEELKGERSNDRDRNSADARSRRDQADHLSTVSSQSPDTDDTKGNKGKIFEIYTLDIDDLPLEQAEKIRQNIKEYAKEDADRQRIKNLTDNILGGKNNPIKIGYENLYFVDRQRQKSLETFTDILGGVPKKAITKTAKAAIQGINTLLSGDFLGLDIRTDEFLDRNMIRGIEKTIPCGGFYNIKGEKQLRKKTC